MFHYYYMQQGCRWVSHPHIQHLARGREVLMHPGTAEPPPSSSQLPSASRSASRLAASLTRRLRARSARPRPPGAAAELDRRRGAPRGGERGRGGVENGSGRRVTKGGGRRAWSRGRGAVRSHSPRTAAGLGVCCPAVGSAFTTGARAEVAARGRRGRAFKPESDKGWRWQLSFADRKAVISARSTRRTARASGGPLR